MPLDPGAFQSKPAGNGPGSRADSVSTSVSGLSGRASGNAPADAARQPKPFIVRNGRTFHADPTLPYPLPVDLTEIHRQHLRTLLLFQLHGGPICSPLFAEKAPKRVLEVGCGTGFWSMMCYRYFERRGQHLDISFTGVDIAPLAPGSAPSDHGHGELPDKNMNWRFVQHDLRNAPWPFKDEEFDLIMVKDMCLALSPTRLQQGLMEEYLRVLAPGGLFELWESDVAIRMLRPHVPEASNPAPQAPPVFNMENRDSSEHERREAASMGAYSMTANTPLSAPLNNFLVEYNGWVSKALEARYMSASPCTVVGAMIIQESAFLQSFGSKRLAVPLAEVRWEREGVGGVVTKDGKSYIETKGRPKGKEASKGKMLEAGAAALRRTALLTVVQMIQSMELMLREVNGKSQDEWDGWVSKMMNDLVNENGASWGECLEIGAWWATKKPAQ